MTTVVSESHGRNRLADQKTGMSMTDATTTTEVKNAPVMATLAARKYLMLTVTIVCMLTLYLPTTVNAVMNCPEVRLWDHVEDDLNPLQHRAHLARCSSHHKGHVHLATKPRIPTMGG